MQDSFPILAALLGGLLSFLSPCVLPLVPGYLSYMAGLKLNEATTGGSSRYKLFYASILFVAGFSTIFILLGAAASSLSFLIRTYQTELSVIAGSLIIIMGLHFIGIFRLTFLYRDIRFRTESRQNRGWITPYILGLAFGFGWTPCIGPILASILVIASSGETAKEGVILLSFYALGLGIPFIVAALGIARFMLVSHFLRRYSRVVELISGLLLCITGLAIISGSLQYLGSSLIDWFPALLNLG